MIWYAVIAMKRNDKRTTISLAEVVWKMAETRMAEEGYNDNFSQYVAELIRADRRRQDELKANQGKDCGTDAGCAGHQDETDYRLNDRLKPAIKSACK